MGLGQNGHDFNVNGLVHIHGGTVTLPREVRTTPLPMASVWLTVAGLGAHLRKATDGREVAQRAEELDKQRLRSSTTDQRLLSLYIDTPGCPSAH